MRLLLYLVLLLVASLVVGGVIALADSFGVYLIVLFPLLMAMAAAGIAIGSEKRFGITHPIAHMLFAILAGALIYSSYRYGEYLFLLAKTEMTTAELGFMKFIELQAKVGFTIGRSSSSGIEIAGNGAWIYWGIEVLLVLGGSIYFLNRLKQQLSTTAAPSTTPTTQ